MYVKPNEKYHPDSVFDGFKEYKMVDGKLEYNIIDDISVYWGRISPKRYGDTDENCNGRCIEFDGRFYSKELDYYTCKSRY